MAHRSDRRPLLLPLTLALLSLCWAPASPARVVEVSGVPAAGLGQPPADPPLAAAHGYWEVDRDVPCVTPEQHAEIEAQLAANVADLRARGLLPETADKEAGVLLQWPLRAAAHLDDPGYHGISNFVDQDATYPNHLLDYNCGTRTYDLSGGYNHAGTDIFTWPFSWLKMANDDVEVVAAAPGVIVGKYDGYADHNCGFGGGQWNAVYVQHADGSTAWYGHMKSGSTTPKNVGASVAAGEYLGVVGSSGNSTGPHLHFELYDSFGQLVDPWSGPCNSLNADGWWAEQRPYYDPAINALRTHSAPPVWPSCPNTEITNEQIHYQAGDLVYFATYYRDQLQNQISTYQLLKPDGSVWQEWTAWLNVPHYAASWWYWSWYLPFGDDGVWKFRVTYQGQTVEHLFSVGTATAAPSVTGTTRLHPAEPNPFNPATSIRFTLGDGGPIDLSIHDLAGRRVATLRRDVLEKGEHLAVWDGSSDDGATAASGVYFVRLATAGASQTQRIVMLK
ncbi:MAG: peptidoglycan DD-metalloendopeptidase family protein [bacterium]|nr:peptidoglycan DD-metalloendopeptidase family protein [bacterium]